MKNKKNQKRVFFLENTVSNEMKEIQAILSKLNVDVYIDKKDVPKDIRVCTFITDKGHTESTIINLMEELTLEDLYISGVIKYHPGDFLKKSKVVFQKNSMGGGWFIDYGDFSAFYPIPSKIIKLFEEKVLVSSSCSGWIYKSGVKR